MHLAAEKGKHLRLRQYLNGNLDALDRAGNTAIGLAAYNGHLRCVQMLIDAKANVNAPTREGITPLMIAGGDGHLDVVQALLNAGADPNGLDSSNLSALSHACLKKKCRHIVPVLLDAKASVHSQVGIESPLFDACRTSCLESVKLLIAAGSDVNHVAEMTPLHASVVGGSLEIAQVLLEAKADVNLMGQEGSNALHFAVSHSLLDFVNLFLTHDADLSLRNSEGSTLLHMGAVKPYVCHEHHDVHNDPTHPHCHHALKDNVGVVNALINAKADINAKAKINHPMGPDLGWTPLLLAANLDNVPVAKALMAAGAAPEVRDTSGKTALQWAVHEGHAEMFRALVDGGASIGLSGGAADGSGDDAGGKKVCLLLEAILSEKPSIVKAVIDAGADVNEIVGYYSMMSYAYMGKNQEIVDILKSAGAKLYLEIMMDKYEYVQHTSDAKGDLVAAHFDEVTDEVRELALIVAITLRYTTFVKYFIQRGVNVNRSHSTFTPLLLAVTTGSVEMVTDLLDAGADVNAKSVTGQSAVQIAMQDKRRDIAQLVLNRLKQIKSKK
jgi:cytohesin